MFGQNGFLDFKMVLVLIVLHFGICGVAIVYCFGKFVGCENFVYTTCVLDGLRPSSLSKSQRKTAEEYTFSLTSPGENQVTALKWMRSIRGLCMSLISLSPMIDRHNAHFYRHSDTTRREK